MNEKLKQCQRIVVKVGTSILTSSRGLFAPTHLAKIGDEVHDLVKGKKQVVLVSSGAIALGMEVSGLKQRPEMISRLQACAAIGQGKLMHAYEQFFSKKGLHTAQVLLTRDALESRDRFLKARQTLEELLAMKALPIVNENDTVATEEIRFGDNDILSVQVSHLIHADLLILLSDVDGFYLKDGSRIRQVSSEQEMDKELMLHLKDERKETTVGGMKAKLEAARIAMRLGVPLLLLNGHEDRIIQRALAGEDVGTIFLPGAERKNAREKWIAFSAARKGAVCVDSGAYEVLSQKKGSLLARGVVKVRGNFEKGEVVELETASGKIFGRGVVDYSSRELSQILGKKSQEIKEMPEFGNYSQVIHRNNLVLWG
jgi:glutamate 5-kinase